MSRTTRYKLGFLAAVCVAAALAFLLVWSVDLDLSIATVFTALILLVPGRVQGVFYRELFKGRILLEQRREQEALDHFRNFLRDVRARPWLKRLIWLSWSVYTPNVEAMALNNIGAANLALGRLGESEGALGEALTLDEKYPLPHFNLAVLQEMRGNRMLAEAELEAAAKLGYVGGTVDTIVNHAQALLARAEGRGVKAT